VLKEAILNNPTLSPRQRQALDAIRAFSQENGYQPTFEEIGEILGIHKATALEHLAALKAKGVVTWEPGQPRTLRILFEIPSAEAAQGTMEVRA